MLHFTLFCDNRKSRKMPHQHEEEEEAKTSHISFYCHLSNTQNISMFSTELIELLYSHRTQ